MDAGYLHGKQFLGFEQMVQVSFGINTVSMATLWVYGSKVGFPFFVAHVHGAFIGEEHCISTVAGWHYAVEHVYSSFDGFEYILRGAYSHEITRFVCRQNVVHYLYHLVHYFCGFAYSQTAYCIAVGSLVGYIFGSLSA